MKRRNLPQNSKKDSVKRERDPLPWRYCLLTLVCGLILVAGFFYAARQHFSAIDFSIKNAKLRQQKEDLESEQRRLYLTREVSLTPTEIKKAAKKIGLQEFTSKGIEFISSKISSVNPLATKNADEKPKPEASSKPDGAKEEKPKVKEEKPKPQRDVKEVKEKKETNKTQNQLLPNERPRLVEK